MCNLHCNCITHESQSCLRFTLDTHAAGTLSSVGPASTSAFFITRAILTWSYCYFLFFAVLGLCCCLRAFSSGHAGGLLSNYGAQASHCAGFSCCPAQALEHAGSVVVQGFSPPPCLIVKEMATHSSTLAWRIPWTEEPGRLQSTGLQSRT